MKYPEIISPFARGIAKIPILLWYNDLSAPQMEPRYKREPFFIKNRAKWKEQVELKKSKVMISLLYSIQKKCHLKMMI